MEDDSIPILGSEPRRTTPENGDFIIPASNGRVAMASGSNEPHRSTSPIRVSTPSIGGRVRAESSASVENPIISRSTTSPLPHPASPGPEAPRHPQEPRDSSSVGECSGGDTRFEEVFVHRPPPAQNVSRRWLPSRSPPSHRSPPYQRSERREQFPSRYSPPHELQSPPMRRVFPQFPQDRTTPPRASPRPVMMESTQRSLNEYYANLRSEYDGLSQQLREMKENLCCRVCLDEEACVVFMPCAHLSTCRTCASQLSSCPICRSLVQYTHVALMDDL